MVDTQLIQRALGDSRRAWGTVVIMAVALILGALFYLYPRTLEVRGQGVDVNFTADAQLIIKDKISQDLVKVVQIPSVVVSAQSGYVVEYAPEWLELPRRLSVDVCFVRASVPVGTAIPEHLYCQKPVEKISYMCDDHNVWTQYFSLSQVADLRAYCGTVRTAAAPAPVVAGDKSDAAVYAPTINYNTTNPTNVVTNTTDMPECDQDEILVWDNNRWNCRDQSTVTTPPAVYPNCAVGEVLTSIGGVLSCVVAGSSSLPPCATNQIYVYDGSAWVCQDENLLYYDESNVVPNTAPNASGSNSVAIGDGAVASGLFAMAFGSNVNAAGTGATALGSSTTANGNYSLAGGLGSNTAGVGSVAIGVSNTAGADGAVALGQSNSSTGLYAFTSGASNSASADGAFALGQSNTASGVGSGAFGSGNAASNSGAMAFGSGNTASGTGAIALGQSNTASGDYAVAGGLASQATNTSATAFGLVSTASGVGATAMGVQAVASGVASTALGASVAASGSNSFAIGTLSTASGLESFTLGSQNTATTQYDFAIGQNNAASGTVSGIVGFNNINQGNQSYILGVQNTIDVAATGSTAVGVNNQIHNGGSYALGTNNVINAGGSRAIGFQTEVNGTFGATLGTLSVVNGFNQTAIGSNNLISGTNIDFNTSKANDEFALILGNADQFAGRSNAWAVSWNGAQTTYGNAGIPIAVAPANTGRMYFDDGLQKFRCSENGSAFSDCFGASVAATTANNGLTINPANNVQLGGLLIQDTLIDQDGNNFEQKNLNAFNVVGTPLPVTLSYQNGNFPYFPTASTQYIQGFSGVMDLSPIIGVPGQIDAFMGLVPNDNDDLLAPTLIKTDGSTLQSIVLGKDGPVLRSEDLTLPGRFSMISMGEDNVYISGTNNLTFDSQTLTLTQFPDTRDDSGLYAPGNFLYTDASGNLLSAPISTLASTPGWSLTGNTGTNSAVNYLGTTDAEDLIIQTNGGVGGDVGSGAIWIGANSTSFSSSVLIGTNGRNSSVQIGGGYGGANSAVSVGGNYFGTGQFVATLGNNATNASELIIDIGSNTNIAGDTILQIGKGIIGGTTADLDFGSEYGGNGLQRINIGSGFVGGAGQQFVLGTNVPTANTTLRGGVLTIESGADVERWPTIAALPGQVLTADGAGVMSWTTPAGGSVTADNGLTINPANNVQLGGTLIQNTLVDQAGFDTTFTNGSFYHNRTSGLSTYGLENGNNLLGIGIDGTMMYETTTPGVFTDLNYILLRDVGITLGATLPNSSGQTSLSPSGSYQTILTDAATNGQVYIQGDAINSTLSFNAQTLSSTVQQDFDGVNGTYSLLANSFFSPAQFRIQPSTTGFTYDFGAQQTFQVANNNRVVIGEGTGNTGFQTVRLELDNKLSAGDPAGANGQMYYNASSNKFRCFENGAWVDCIGGALTAANNGLTVSGSNAQLGGALIQNTTVTNNGFDLIFDGTGNGSGKVASFLGDIDVTGTIDPTRILFSNLAGVNSPSYNPSANGSNYSVRFQEGGNLNFQSDTTNDILHLSNSGLVGIGTGTPVYNLDVVGMMNQVAVLPGGRTTNVHSGDNVIGAGIKGVGFTTQDPATGALGYLFAGDSTSTGGAPNQAGVGLTNFSTGQNGQLFISDQTGNYAVSLQANNGSNNVGTDWYGSTINSFVNDSLNGSSLTFEPLLLTLNNADLQLNSYQSGRDDTSSFSPLNFLYTDNAGRVLSAPTSAITGALTASNGLTRVSDDFRLGGLLTQNTTIDTAGFDIVSTQTDVDGGVLRNGLFINPSTFIDTETIAGSTYYNPVQNYEVFNGIIPSNQPDANFSGLLYADGNVLNRYLQVGINNRNINIRENDATGATGLEIVNRDMNLYAQGGAKISIRPTNVSGATVGQVLTMVGANGEAEWADAPSATAVAWALTGNPGTTAGTNFIGTTDDEDFVMKVNSQEMLRLISDAGGSGVPAFTTWDNVVTGPLSIAFGQSNTVSGGESIAWNESNTASGSFSTAFGNGSTASGYGSVAFGQNNEAFSFTETALGHYGTSYTPVSPSSINGADRLFNIGNGTGSGSESDAFTILKNGQTGIGIDNFEANTNGNIFQVGDGLTGVIGYVDNGTGNWVAVSDERKKRNIVDLEYGLAEVNALRPVSFDYKRNGEHTIGFLAQQVRGIIPEAVSGSEAEGYGMSYSTLVPAVVRGVQELSVKTDINTNSISALLGTQANDINTLNTAITNIQNKGDSVEDMLAALNTNDQNFLTQFDALLDSVAVQQDSISELLVALSDLRLDVESLTARVASLEQNQKKELTGRVKIKKGDTKATIDFANSFDADPIITLTPYNFVDGKYAVSNLSKSSFEIKLSVEQDESVTFDWRAVEASNDDSSSDSSGGSDDDSDSSDDSSSDDDTSDTPPAPTPEPTPETDPDSGSTEGESTDTNTGSDSGDNSDTPADSGSGDTPTE